MDIKNLKVLESASMINKIMDSMKKMDWIGYSSAKGAIASDVSSAFYPSPGYKIGSIVCEGKKRERQKDSSLQIRRRRVESFVHVVRAGE